jgi:hypothetical protein
MKTDKTKTFMKEAIFSLKDIHLDGIDIPDLVVQNLLECTDTVVPYFILSFPTTSNFY